MGCPSRPRPNYNGAASLQIVTNDQGNSGSGGAARDTDTVAITVNAVNDAPLNTVPGPQSTNEDTSLVFNAGNGNLIWIADLDAGAGAVQVTLTATNGAITLSRHHGSLVHRRRRHQRRDDDLYGHSGQYQRGAQWAELCANRQLQRRGQPADRHERPRQYRQRGSALRQRYGEHHGQRGQRCSGQHHAWPTEHQ